jgi:hypothetical protein
MSEMRWEPDSGVSRRGLLRSGLLAGLGAAGLVAAVPALTGVARADVEENVTIDGHPYTAQGQWNWCTLCSGLFWCPSALPTGVCPGNGSGKHTPGATEYWMLHGGANWNNPTTDPNGVQAGWRWCSNCDVQFWGPGASHSACPVGFPNSHHVLGSGTIYDMMFGTAWPADLFPQDGFAWCSACQGLFWSGKGGKCPGTNNMGFAHTVGSITDYDLLWGDNP